MISEANFVDRLNNRIVGYIVAQTGDFKDRRGHFDCDSLGAIVKLGNAEPRGVLSRFKHANMIDDGADRLLGRMTNWRRDGSSVRADLGFAPVALEPPPGGGIHTDNTQ